MTQLSTPPVPGTPRPYRFPATTRHTRTSGLRVAVARLTRVPLVTVTVVFRGAGARTDPEGSEGLAHLTADLLLEGTATRDGVALAEYFESLGSSLTASADWDATLVSFSVHPDRLEAALHGMSDVLGAPAFPADQLARLQAEHHAERLQSIADPRELANLAFEWTCFAASSRYRRPIEGTLASHSSLSRDAVVDFWRSRYTAPNVTLVIAGDVDDARATAIAAQLESSLPSGTASVPVLSATARYPTTRITLVEKAGAAQAELRIGLLGVERTHPDYFRLIVANGVLGGLFSSRINLNLRERHGYTYGAFSSFDWRRDATPWVLSTAVKTEVCGAAAAEVLAEIRRFGEETIATSELELAANYLVGVFPLRFETTAAVAGALASQAALELNDEYFDEYRDRIAAVTPSQIRETAIAHLNPQALQIVAVGDPELLSAQLVSLGPGGFILRSAEQIEAAP